MKKLKQTNNEKILKKLTAELLIANKKIVYENKEKAKRADELLIANKKIVYENKEKAKRADELLIANKKIVITKKIASEKQNSLNILNEQLNRAQATAKIGSWSWDSVTDKITWSKELYDIYGLDHHFPAPNYLEHLKLYTLDSRKILDSAVKICLEKGKSYEVQLQLADISKGKKFVVGKGEVVKNSKGQIVGQRGTIQDITKQKNLEDKVLLSTALIHSLLDAIPDAIFYKDKSGVYVGCNPAFSKVVGRPRDKIVGFNDYDFFSKKVADDFRMHDQAMLKIDKIRQNEEWVAYPNGQKRLLETLKIPYGGVDKNSRGILGVSRDITERKKLEDNIRANLEQQSFLSSISLELNQYNNFDFVFNNVLKRLAIYMGASRAYIFEDSMSGKSTSNTYEWCADGVKPRIDSLKNILYSAAPVFLKLFKKDGVVMSSDVSKLPKDLRNILEEQNIKSIVLLSLFAGRKRIGFFGLDVIDQKRDWKTSEVQLLKNIANSIASVYERKEIDKIKSEFISIASHQLKTPLTGIKWLSELLLGEKIDKPSQKQKGYLWDIYVSNQRMIKLVDDLLNVSRMEIGNKLNIVKKKTDIIKIIDQVLLDNQQLVKKEKINIIKCKGAPRKLIINIDADNIRQVFSNLINNAIKYSKNRGLVEIGWKSKNGEIIFWVKDKGIGIPNGQQDRVFEKFFRSDNAAKQETDGTGLGLYIAKTIIEAHGGKIWFESEEGKGSKFYFSLPA